VIEIDRVIVFIKNLRMSYCLINFLINQPVLTLDAPCFTAIRMNKIHAKQQSQTAYMMLVSNRPNSLCSIEGSTQDEKTQALLFALLASLFSPVLRSDNAAIAKRLHSDSKAIAKQLRSDSKANAKKIRNE
jgi:hypothetical protein